MRPSTRTLLPLIAFCMMAPLDPLSARTPAEVACEEAKLGRMVHRFSSPGSGDNLFLWSTGGNRISGLSVLSPFGGPLGRDELQLAFDLTLVPAGGLLNPRRAPLPQLTLARRDPASNISATEVVTSATFELAPEVIDPSMPQQGLTITGRLGSPTGSASGAGRALVADGLFERCPGGEPSAFDLQVFEILSRTVRVSEALLRPFPGPGGDNFKAILFRDVEPLSYRVKVFLYYTVEGEYSESPLQFRVRFALDGSGGWAAGGIESLPWCHGGAAPPCTDLLNPGIGLVVAPPIFAGHEVQTVAQYLSGAFLNVPFETSPDNILTDDVPWPDLLRGTAWERPVGVAEGKGGGA